MPHSKNNSLAVTPGQEQPRVLALSDQYPNLLEPQRASFNRQQLAALASLCPLALVAPVAWPHLFKAGRFSLPAQERPFATEWPVFWYLPRWQRRLHGRAFFLSAWPALRRRAAALGPNVLLATWLFPAGWAGLLAARRLGLPLVIKLHGSDLLVLKQDPSRLPYLRQALAGANRVVAVSQPLADEALSLGARNVALVPNGLNQELFAPADQTRARNDLDLPVHGRLLVFVGRLHPIKGPDLALEALARLERVSLVMVGGGPLENSLKQKARELGVAGRVIWAGPQPHRKVPRYLAAADALVLPSRSEGDPNAVLEALGCGRPVVAARVGGVAQAVSDGINGALFPADDAAAMAEAVRWILGRNWPPEELCQAVAGRSWPASAAALCQVLAEAVAEGPA